MFVMKKLTKRWPATGLALTLLLSAAPVWAASGMVFPGSRWEKASPGSQGVNAARLREAIAYLEQHAPRDGVGTLAILRHGRLIHEGSRIDKAYGIQSCTKSFTSTVLGLLIDDGRCTLETPAKDFVPAMKAHYPDVTLRHFTTMTSGYQAIADEPQGDYHHGPSLRSFEPNPRPVFSPPGSKYAYWDSAMNQFAHVLTRIAGEPIEELFRRRIAEPIGMNPKKWDWGDFGEIDGVVVNGGSGNHDQHIYISAREIARLGHLFLNRGNWDGKQLISSDWVAQATQTQVPASTPFGYSGIEGPGVYGYNWWANGVKPNGGRKWPGVPEGAFAAYGYDNNKMFVIPAWGVVVVRLGKDQTGDGGFRISDETWAAFLRQVGEAIE